MIILPELKSKVMNLFTKGRKLTLKKLSKYFTKEEMSFLKTTLTELELEGYIYQTKNRPVRLLC
jgi:hypothetical protein